MLNKTIDKLFISDLIADQKEKMNKIRYSKKASVFNFSCLLLLML